VNEEQKGLSQSMKTVGAPVWSRTRQASTLIESRF